MGVQLTSDTILDKDSAYFIVNKRKHMLHRLAKVTKNESKIPVATSLSLARLIKNKSGADAKKTKTASSIILDWGQTHNIATTIKTNKYGIKYSGAVSILSLLTSVPMTDNR